MDNDDKVADNFFDGGSNESLPDLNKDDLDVDMSQ